MQILNFNRISIKNRGLDVTFPFTTFARANFPNTRIFLFTLKKFAPKIFKTLLQECSKRMFSSHLFFEIRSDDFIIIYIKKESGERLHARRARGGRKCITRTFLLFPSPPPRKWSETRNCYSWAGENKGTWGHFFEAPPAFTRLNIGVSTIIPPTHSLHPFEYRFHVYLKILADLISSNSLAWVDKWVSWQIVIADPFQIPRSVKAFPFPRRRFWQEDLENEFLSQFQIFIICKANVSVIS